MILPIKRILPDLAIDGICPVFASYLPFHEFQENVAGPDHSL